MDWATTFAAGSVALSVLSVAYFGGYKLGRLELKVDTMWDFIIRRAMVEGVQKGIGKIESPFTLGAQNAEEATKAHPELVKDLLVFYEQHKQLDDHDLFIAIEREFGNRLVREVCLKYGLELGSCVIGAMALCRESEGKTVSIS